MLRLQLGWSIDTTVTWVSVRCVNDKLKGKERISAQKTAEKKGKEHGEKRKKKRKSRGQDRSFIIKIWPTALVLPGLCL